MADNTASFSGVELPPYLSAGVKQKLYQDLKNFPNNLDQVYWSPTDPDCRQGEGFSEFCYIYRTSGDLLTKSVKGIVVSNSCDIAPANKPDPWKNVLFAPIAPLDKYIARLAGAGKDKVSIDGVVDSIRRQRVTDLFYLPAKGVEFPESIVPLDDIRPESVHDFHARQPARLFSLNQYGWYIFLIKLSIHFTRLQEGVQRADE